MSGAESIVYINIGISVKSLKIKFNKFNFQVKPKAGTLIYFPADGRYMHTALPVTSGVRYALVSWMSQEGVEKIRAPSKYTVRLRPD